MIPSPLFLTTTISHLRTSVNEFGEAAHRRMVVSGQVLSTSLVSTSILMMLSLVTPSRRGTTLLRARIFSYVMCVMVGGFVGTASV